MATIIRDSDGRFMLPPPHPWWYLPDSARVPGQINGLSSFAGTPIMTNGPLILIENGTGDACIGHKDWFVADSTRNENKQSRTTGNKATKSRKKTRADLRRAEEYA